MMDQDQLNRIEKKLDDMLEFRDALLKFAMPKVPESMRTKMMGLMAAKEARRG